MAHYLSAIMTTADSEGFARFGDLSEHSISLPQRLRMYPATPALLRVILPEGTPIPTPWLNSVMLDSTGVDGMPAELIEVLAGASDAAPVAYIETDLHGGTGSQLALVWRNMWRSGTLVYASHDHWGHERLPEPTAINGALAKHFGVQRGNQIDEFDAIGLDAYRYMDHFIEEPHRCDYFSPDWITRYRTRS